MVNRLLVQEVLSCMDSRFVRVYICHAAPSRSRMQSAALRRREMETWILMVIVEVKSEVGMMLQLSVALNYLRPQKYSNKSTVQVSSKTKYDTFLALPSSLLESPLGAISNCKTALA